MIQVTPQMRILVAVEPADFRKGIDGLARVCRETLRRDPFSGYVFVFGNAAARRSRSWSMMGRASGCAKSGCQKDGSGGGRRRGHPATETLEAHQLTVLLSGGKPGGGERGSPLAAGGGRAVSPPVLGKGGFSSRGLKSEHPVVR